MTWLALPEFANSLVLADGPTRKLFCLSGPEHACLPIPDEFRVEPVDHSLRQVCMPENAVPGSQIETGTLLGYWENIRQDI